VRLELTDDRRTPGKPLCTLAFSPDGKLLATGDKQGTIRLWNPTRGKDLATLEEPGGELFQIAFSPDSKLLAAARDGGATQLWDVRLAKFRTTLRLGTKAVYCLAFSPDGKTLATGGEERAVCLWDVARGTPGATLWGPSFVRCLTFHPDGRTLVAAGGTKDVLVRDVPGKRAPFATGLVGHDSGVRSALWRADGGLLITAGETDGTVWLWDPSATPLRARALRIKRPRAPGPCAIALSPEGRHLAVTHPNGTIYVLRLAPPGKPFHLP
jgi:WD40 repeat protein